MISLIITSYNEPKATVRAVLSLLTQEIPKPFQIFVVDPFPAVGNYLKKKVKDKHVKFFLDSGEGKAHALNLLLEKIYSINTEDIIIFTDGDVFVSDATIEALLAPFADKKVGCVTGRPLTINPRTTKYGYWSKVLYDAIHRVRISLHQEKKFFQCSGYLFSIRNGLLKEIPLDVPEDAIIPYLIWKQSYMIAYAPAAEVYIKYPDNWRDWLNQRVRTIKAHENIPLFAPNMPRTKSFFNEIKEGLFFTLMQPKNLQEFWWTLELYGARIYIYIKSFIEMRGKKAFDPAWRDIEILSTKPLD